jgi:NADH dehydrogenase (ubiquinone) 1 alpha subcomplex subunit 12
LTTAQQHDFNASQVTPEWHAWLTHIRHLPPPEDPIMQASKQPWQTVRRLSALLLSDSRASRSAADLARRDKQPHFENLTGTRGAFKTYSTTKPKIAGWEPKIAQRA